ncbi:hypothetical protein [Actinomadura rugatobispora]|uniref:DUF2269 family protein n=1 Tax=Actinomadura rugatobispora TaxID=1994 RepID=A0ABW1A0X3_9ACTN|nr:hypothetical protein GCM10010200_010450 [Actinomadura rugatobispora]
MEYAALGTWIIAAGGGTYLMAGWLAQGGLMEQATKVTRYPVLVVVGHPLAALVGLAAWVAYLATGRAGYAWVAFTALLVVILQGFLLFTRWLVGRGGRHARGAEQPFPAVAVTVHGVVAIATFVLVFLTAIEASHG